jgi:putative tricarboxylic transport membrane protein
MYNDIISGLFLLLISVFIIIQSLNWSFWKLGPGAGFLPFVVGFLLGIMSIILVVKGTLRRKFQKQEAEESILSPKKRIFLLYVSLIVFYYLIFKPLGFLISSISFLILIIRFAESQPWKKAIWFSVALAAAYYVAFHFILKIPLPQGFFSLLG